MIDDWTVSVVATAIVWKMSAWQKWQWSADCWSFVVLVCYFFFSLLLCVCVCVEPAQSIIQKDTFINVKRAQSVGFSTHTQTHIQYCQIQSAPESGCDDVTIFWFSRCVSVLCLCRHLPYFNVAWAWQHGPVPTSLSMIFFRVYNNLLMRWMMMMMCSCVCRCAFEVQTTQLFALW